MSRPGDIAREFNLPAYRRLTPDLSAAERLAVFLGFTPEMRSEAWRELNERVERQGRALFAEWRLGDWCTAQEMADEIAYLWETECRHVPLGGVGLPEPARRPPTSPRRRAPIRRDHDLDELRSIPSATFVPMLTGREVDRAGFVQCPLHADGQERSPSLHLSVQDGRWHCFGCQRGGDLFDFFAALNGRGVPAGGEFFDFAGEVAAALGAAGA